MKKRILIFISILFIFAASLFSLELGLIAGSITKPSEAIYGISACSGIIIPLLKFEVEYYNLADRKFEALTTGVKLRKRFRKFAPYGVVGVGSEFDNLTFNFDKYETFFFVGGGIHLYVGGFLSLRADIRFLNFSDTNKTRLSVGAFFHL
jgi:hypothetical protein